MLAKLGQIWINFYVYFANFIRLKWENSIYLSFEFRHIGKDKILIELDIKKHFLLKLVFATESYVCRGRWIFSDIFKKYAACSLKVYAAHFFH